MAELKARYLPVLVLTAALAGCLPATSDVGTSPAEQNAAPAISGSPPTQVMAGTPYQFQPSATDNDGDALTFSATGLPTWASINAQSGRIQGTPNAAHAGVSSSIVVSVSDGTVSASLPAFRITVMTSTTTPPPASGSASLSWAVPTQYTDGSSLPRDDLLGYRVYHGTNASSLDRYLDIDGPATTTYEVRELGPGEHCFAITAVSVSNVESALSGVGCKRI